MKYTPVILVLLLIYCLSGTGLAAGEVILAADGKAAATIVVGPDDGHGSIHTREHTNITYRVPSNALAEAARDLAWHLNEMAGLWRPENRIKVVDTVAEARTPYRILLGDAAIEAHGLQADAAMIPYPGYVYQTLGNDLLIYGSSSKGAANGVYGFLQDELGVRWFAPNKSFTVVPREDTVSVSDLYEIVEPSFPGRLVHVEGAEWPRRMRMGDRIDEGEPFRNTSHNLRSIFRPDRYYESNPEYYAMRGGRRQDAVKQPFSKNFGICYSNPEVVDIATEAALTHFRKGEHYHSFSLGINDGAAYCECPECAELQPDRFFRGQRVASDMYYHFVNEVARRVAREFPDRYIGVIAYSDVTAPPLGDVEGNVHVVLVNDIAEYFDPSYRAHDEQLVNLWEEKGNTMGLYYYTQLAKLVPAHFPRLLDEELKDKYYRGYTSVTSEFGQGWPWHGPMSYVEARLLWDVDLDVDVLLDEYFTLLYGPAGPHMRELYELFEEIHMRPRSGRFLGEHYQFSQFRPYTGEDLEKIESLLAAAHEAVGGVSQRETQVDRDVQRRLGYVNNGLRVFLDMLEGYALAQELEQKPRFLDDVEATERLQKIERVNAIMASHEATYRQAIMDDDHMPGRFYRDTATPVRNHWKGFLSAAVGDALADIHKSVNEGRGRFHPRVEERLQEEVEEFGEDPARRQILRVKTGVAELGDNIVPNPGFEEVWGEGAHTSIPEGEEWRRGRPEGWGVSPNAREGGVHIDTVELQDGESGHGRRAARMKNIGGRGYYSRVMHGIQPGQAFLCQARAKLNISGARIETIPHVFMRIWWRSKEGGWMRSPAFIAELRETDTWDLLETVAIAPEGANAIAVFLIAEGLTDELEVLFDDVSVRKIN